MSEKLTKLVVAIEAQNAQFLNELNRTRKETTRWKNQTQGSLDSVAKSSVKSTAVMRGGFRAARGAAGQFGYQIQDVAVQLQAGQSALLVFGQQGSQIASIFGPGGAVLGAVLAVGAALGTAFLPNLMKSGDATADLTEKMKKLNEQYYTLTSAQRSVLTSEQTEAIKEQESIIESNRAKVERLTRAQEALAESQSTQLTGLARFAPAFADIYTGIERAADGAAESQRDFAAEIETATQAIAGAEEEIRNLNSGFKDGEKNVDGIIDALTKQAATFGYTARQMSLYEAGLEGATQEELQRISTLYDFIDAQKALQDSLKDTTRAEQKKIRDAQFRQVDDIMKVGIGGYGGANSSLGSSEEAKTLESVDQKMGVLVELTRNGKSILV